MAFIYDLADTWNNGGTTFTAIKMNVTDTASASASLLMDLQVGGSSKLKVDKGGRISSGYGYVFAKPQFWDHSVGDGNGLGISSNQVTLYANGSAAFGASRDSLNGVRLSFEMPLGWSPSHAIGAASDLRLYRDAAGTLGQRNSTNAQTFNLYNTYTDASNYERGFMKWNSNVLEIGAEAAGTGTGTREIQFINNSATRLTINSSGHTVVTTGRSLFLGNSVSWTQVSNQMQLGGGSLEMVEQTAPAAPAANHVRIYAEDDGAGKTRLMALFATGAAQQIAIEP